MWVYDFKFCFFRFVELPYARVKKDILRIDLLLGFVLIKDSDSKVYDQTLLMHNAVYGCFLASSVLP